MLAVAPGYDSTHLLIKFCPSGPKHNGDVEVEDDDVIH